MIIQISDHEGRSGTELCICEFQGEVEGELAGNELGKITISETGNALMDIGLHLLEGNIVKLKLPFLVIEKRKRTRSPSNSEQERSGPDSDLTDSPSLDIIGVVRKKIIFKTRPKPKCNVTRN